MKTLFAVFVMLAISTSFSYSESIKDKVFGDVFVSEVTSVYDGDTFRCNIEY